MLAEWILGEIEVLFCRPVERLQCRVDTLSLLTDKVNMYDVPYLFRVWY
jgi:hypothetical protein